MVLSMERWVGKVAVVTGASSGIGAAIAKQLVENGMFVAGLARREEKVDQLAKELEGAKGKLYSVKCDITNFDDLVKAFKSITKKLGPVHVLVNNAGMMCKSTLSDGDTEIWKKVFDLNVIALSVATREAIRIMKANDINGHIFHINSTSAHSVPRIPELNVYSASKHAVKALAETLRFELLDQKSLIKITSISPGFTRTEIVLQYTTEEQVSRIPKQYCLDAEDVADSVLYALSTPPHVQIKELTLIPIAEMTAPEQKSS